MQESPSASDGRTRLDLSLSERLRPNDENGKPNGVTNQPSSPLSRVIPSACHGSGKDLIITRYDANPLGCARCQFHAVSMVCMMSEYWGLKPSSVLMRVGSAYSCDGSPSRRGAGEAGMS